MDSTCTTVLEMPGYARPGGRMVSFSPQTRYRDKC